MVVLGWWGLVGLGVIGWEGFVGLIGGVIVLLRVNVILVLDWIEVIWVVLIFGLFKSIRGVVMNKMFEICMIFFIFYFFFFVYF